MRIVALECGDMVAQELCGFRTRMSNERFGLGEFQLEVFLQKRSKLPLDLLGFFLWTNKTQQKVIGISTIPEPPIIWVVRVY